MADPMRLPPMHTVERDNYEANLKRKRFCPKPCGKKKHVGAPLCIACTYPERVAAMSRPTEFYRKAKP